MTVQQELIPLCMGERLRQERESRRISLEKVARDLRIDEPVVRAIEEDKLGHLAPVYRRGYVSSYANYLKFESSEIEQMLDSIDNVHPELHTVFPEAANPNQTDRWLKATSYVMASLLIGTLAWQFTHEAVRLSQDANEMVTGAINAGTSEPALNASTQQIEGATHINASIAALEVKQATASPRTGAGQEAWAAVQSSSPESGIRPAHGNGEYTLELTASGDSWVEIMDAQGNQLEQDLVRGGTSKQYQGVAPFNIQFGRASAVSLFMEGQAVDLSPFTNGGVTQMMLEAPSDKTTDGAQDPGKG